MYSDRGQSKLHTHFEGVLTNVYKKRFYSHTSDKQIVFFHFFLKLGDKNGISSYGIMKLSNYAFFTGIVFQHAMLFCPARFVQLK